MDIKTEFEIKDEPLEISEDAENRDQCFEQEAQFGEIQIFPDNEANDTLLEGIKNEDLDESVKSELIKSGMESVFGKGLVSSDSIKSDNILKFKNKSNAQHLKKFMTLKNVSSLLKKIDENGFKSQFESDEERFFAELLMSKIPLVTLKKWSDEELKISISVEANGEEDDNHKSKTSLFKEPEASKQNQRNEKHYLEKYCCTCCNCSFKNEDELKIHLKSNKKRKFRCAHCNYECSFKSNLRRHIQIHSDLKLFKCSECAYKCKRKDDLKRHMLTHGNFKLFKCAECSYETNIKSSLKSHMLTHVNYKLFKCAECSYQCNQKSVLQTHMLAHANIKLFKCLECSYETNIKSSLKSHMLTHANYKLFKCAECSYQCNWKRILRTHMLSHANIKLFKCSECNYETNLKENLKSHMSTHTKFKLFKCIECGYECNHKEALKRHKLKHANLLKCKQCSYECSFKETLKRHILTHSNSEFSYECNQKEDLNMNILNYLDVQSAALNEIIKKPSKDTF